MTALLLYGVATAAERRDEGGRRDSMFERERVKVFDTTLRDGEQSPGCSMNREEKLRMAHQLERLGVDVIEAGFPIASDGEYRAVQAVAREVRRPVIAALARACHDDIQCAWQAIQGAAHPRIHTFLATSDIHLQPQAAPLAPPVSGTGARRGAAGGVALRGCRVLPRRRHSYRPGVSLCGAGGRDRSGCDHAEYS